MRKTLDFFRNYLSLVKFAHTVFAMPFALTGFFLASREPGREFSLRLFLLVLLCMVFARNSAMGFNRYADREIDGLNPRTLLREIPSRIIASKSALWFVLLNALLFILATWFINPLCFYLSPVALVIILGYSLTKRFTFLSHLILGLGLGLAPIGAYISVTGYFSPAPVLLSLAVIFWTAGFDIIYALQDEEFDIAHRLRSIPAKWGKAKALGISSAFHIVSGVFIIATGLSLHGGILYWGGSLIFLVLLVYQHTLVKPGDLSKVNVAFFSTNGFASIIFAIFAIAGILSGI